MVAALFAKWRAFLTNNRGGVLIFVSLIMLPLMLVLGVAVDSSVGLEQKRKLQMACDAAAKAGAANGNGVTATITSEAQKVFAANTSNMTGITGPVVTIDPSGDFFTVSASITVNNYFMTLGGIPTSTYTASASANLTLSEVVIFYEFSYLSSMASNFNTNVCSQLMNFVNALPSTTMVSIVPVATEFQLDSTTTNSSALFNHLSNTTNDQLVNPAHYPLSLSLTWNTTNYNAAPNLFYLPYATSSGGNEGMYYVTPTANVSNSTGGLCPGNYSACPTTLYPNNCPSTTHQSCSNHYYYNIRKPALILPLTLNRTLISQYITTLSQSFGNCQGFFPSLISWAWRAIDASWNDFWLVNSNAQTTTRASGTYPAAYSSKYPKSIVIIAYDTPYWEEYLWATGTYNINKCGSTSVSNVDGTHTFQWPTNAYGMYPVPTDYYSNAYDITCQNYYYKTIDQTLGLNSTASNNWQGTLSISTYTPAILTAVQNKFNAICTSIKADGINIYVIAANGSSYYSSCVNSSGNIYTITNTTSSINTALQAVAAKIAASF